MFESILYCARMQAKYYNGGPMTADEYNSHDRSHADDLNRFRSRTFIGWVISETGHELYDRFDDLRYRFRGFLMKFGR